MLVISSPSSSSPEDVLSFGIRALRILISNDDTNTPCLGKSFSEFSICIGSRHNPCSQFHKSSLYIAHLCNLLSVTSLKLKRYNESLSYLNWANRNLSNLEKDGNETCCTSKCFSYTSHDTRIELFKLKQYMGRIDEAVVYLRKALEIKQQFMEEGCIDLGWLNQYVSTTSMTIMNYEEALPFCLKALEIYTKHFGHNSMEVVRLMRQLALIYNELGEYAKALEQNQISRNVLKNMSPYSPKLLDLEVDHADFLIGLGMYEAAIVVLKRVISHTDIEEGTLVSAFVIIARALCCLEKFADAKKYMTTSQRILERIEMDPINVAILIRDISSLYEKMNDYGNAISLLRKALSIPEIPQKFLAQGSARLFSLISLSGKVEEGISYMEDVVEKLKEKFGAEHCEVGHSYKNLGASYMKSGQEELAVKFMVRAKDIMDVALGPHHLDSLKTSHALAETYAIMRRYDPAVEIQINVVDGLKVLEPCEQEFLDIAVKLLNEMKERVAESPTKTSPQSKDDEDLSAKFSKWFISDDEKDLLKS